ncbi:MFS transporter [Crossiella cryophila]
MQPVLVPARPVIMGLGAGFARLWVVGTVSAVGDGVTMVAGPLLAAALTRDPVQVAGLAVAQQSAGLVFGLPGGALVDRVGRRRVLVVAALTRSVALAVLGLVLLAGQASLWLLYLVFFVVGCAGVVFENAASTMVPALVGPAGLARAHGRLLGSAVVGRDLLAKPVGAMLFVVAVWVPFLVDAGALLLVAALCLRLPAGVAERGGPRGSLWAEMAGGVRWLLRHRVLRALTAVIAVSNVALGAMAAVLVLIARERLGLGEVGYGLLLVAAAVGGVLGGLLADRLIGWLGVPVFLRAGFALEAVAHLVLAVSREVVVVAAALMVFWGYLVVSSTVGASLRQSLVPAELLGRVHSSYRWLSGAAMLAGSALGGVLARYFGLAAPFWLGAVGVGLLVLVFPVRVFRGVTLATTR